MMGDYNWSHYPYESLGNYYNTSNIHKIIELPQKILMKSKLPVSYCDVIELSLLNVNAWDISLLYYAKY